MIHVPDVACTAAWYQSIGFRLLRTNEEDGESDWASLSFGNSEVMLSSGGKPSAENRREVDLYITVDSVDDIYRRIQEKAPIIEGLHDLSTTCASSLFETAMDSGSRLDDR
jgi:hypothetical protein